MTNKATAAGCSRPRLDDYLAGSLSESEMAAVEDHLSGCPDCSNQLESVAASEEAWRQTRDLLSEDIFDGATSLAMPLATVGADDDSAGLSCGDIGVKKRRDAAMLLREIQGWLDPTDDPSMLGRFAGYEIVGIVGHGGNGIVLKGFESALNRFVAIKVLAPRLATSDAARKRFAREAQAAAAVIHENVIAIHRVDESHGLPFLVMPYLGGLSLQKRIDAEGPLSIEAILRIGSQIAAGLAAAHAQGLVHRDIKPANIMLDRGVERVTITDFGLARAADDASVTHTGMIAGTPQYMSPEQARAQRLDARSDLFSLGSVLYVMASGKPPFSGTASFEILNQIVDSSPPPIRRLNPAIPDWFEALVDRLHQQEPDNRLGSASELRRWIDACLQHLREPAKPLPPELVQHRPQRRLGWRVTAVAIACLTVVLALMFAPLDEFRDSTTKTTQPGRAMPATGSAMEPAASVAGSAKTQDTDPLPSDLKIDTDIETLESEINALEQELTE